MTFCVLGANCSVYDRSKKIAGVSLHKQLCEGCRMRAVSELNLLRYDFVDLSQMIPKRDSIPEANIARGKPESSVPFDVAVFALRDEIVWTLTKAEDHLRALLGDDIGVRVPARDGYAIEASVRYLVTRVDELTALSAMYGPVGEDMENLSGVDLLSRFGSLHRRSRRACGLDAGVVSVPGYCPGCGLTSLRRHDDEPGRIWCARCPQRLGQEGYYAAQRMQFAPSQPPA